MTAACRGGWAHAMLARLEWSQELETLVITGEDITYKICVH